MPPAKDPSSGDSENIPKTPAKIPEGFEKVVDELRNVLSGLNKSSTADFVQEPALPEEDLLRSQPLLNNSTDLESERLGEAAFNQASEPTAMDNPSDAEFWKGNVLGWPNPPPENVETPAPLDAPIPSQGFSPFQEDFSIPSAPLSPLSKSDDVRSPVENFSGFSEPEPIQNKVDLPPMPVAPGEESDQNSDEMQRTAFLGNLRIPIPGTLHQMPASNSKNKNDSTLDEMNIRAKQHILIACLFPDGQDDLANDFLSKIKMAAAKAVGYPEIEIVLSTPWFLAQIDLHSWKKAASLSGAHFMFVLAFRKDKDLFRDLTKVTHQDEVRARLVFVEQINLKTLYADLLADVIRNFNGQS